MFDTPTAFDLDIDRETVAVREATIRADDWLRNHPDADPEAVVRTFLAECRLEAGLGGS